MHDIYPKFRNIKPPTVFFLAEVCNLLFLLLFTGGHTYIGYTTIPLSDFLLSISVYLVVIIV